MALHPALTIALTLVAAWLMTRAGLAKNALELKRRRFVCPSCGKDLNQGPCKCAPEAAAGPWDALKNVKFD